MASTDATIGRRQGRWRQSDSLVVLLGVALLTVVAAHLWTVFLLPPFNSEHLGVDACQHAVLIYCQSLPNPTERAVLADFLATYPQMSHWLAAQWMPLLHGDPYKAMRAVSAASVMLMLVCQFWILRRALPTPWALLALLVWQCLCKSTNTANTQYYCVAYFYAQAVGTNFFWAALVFFTWPARGRWQALLHTTLGAACAASAYLCHIVPGVTVLGGLGLLLVGRACRSRCRLDWARFTVVAAVGLAVVLGTEQLSYMSDARQGLGAVPVKSWSLLITWVPTLVLIVVQFGRRWLVQGERSPVESLMAALACVLLAAGLLQGYCGMEYLLGKSALYGFNKLFFILFPVSSMIWVVAGAKWLQNHGGLFLASKRLLTGWRGRVAWTLALGTLAVADGQAFVENELVVEISRVRNEAVEAQRHPMQVCRRLAWELAHAAEAKKTPWAADPRWRSDLIYFDPDLWHASFFINVVGLHRDWTSADTAEHALAGWPAGKILPPELHRIVQFDRLLKPLERIDGPAHEVACNAAGI